MLLEFTVKNYRSFRDKQTLSLVPDEGKNEFEGNVLNINKGQSMLRTALVYGANASGKSNLMKAMQVLRNLILTSGDNKPDQVFEEYDPFIFNADSSSQPTSFGIDFSLDKVRHHYEIEILNKLVVKESLLFYPQGREAKLFVREGQQFEFGDYLKGQRAVVAELTGINQLFLSKGALNNIKQLVQVYQYFAKDFMTIPFLDIWMDDLYTSRIARELKEMEGNEIFIKNFNNLLMSFDTGITGFSIEKNNLSHDDYYDIFVDHYMYDDKGEKVGSKKHPFEEESTGTQKLFVLAGVVLRALMNGRVIMIDEYERSLHPFITSFIIQMFHDPKINAKGAQLIVATHDTSLLSNSELRRDQVWIVEKDHQGASSLFSLADINGVRSNLPFEKWYLSGRLGGVPGIETLNFELNFQNEEV